MADLSPAPTVFPTSAGRLAPLLRCAATPSSLWSTADWRAILSHQLAAPLLFDRQQLSPMDRALLDDCTLAGATPASFGQVLSHPSPPVGLLVLIKDYAKACDADADRPLPGEVASALYYAAIFAALVRRRQRISTLSDQALARAAAWGMGADWIGPELKDLFQLALQGLG